MIHLDPQRKAMIARARAFDWTAHAAAAAAQERFGELFAEYDGSCLMLTDELGIEGENVIYFPAIYFAELLEALRNCDEERYMGQFDLYFEDAGAGASSVEINYSYYDADESPCGASVRLEAEHAQRFCDWLAQLHLPPDFSQPLPDEIEPDPQG